MDGPLWSPMPHYRPRGGDEIAVVVKPIMARHYSRTAGFSPRGEAGRAWRPLRRLTGPTPPRLPASAGLLGAPASPCRDCHQQLYPRSLSVTGWAATLGITALTAPATFAEGASPKDTRIRLDRARPQRGPRASRELRSQTTQSHLARTLARRWILSRVLCTCRLNAHPADGSPFQRSDYSSIKEPRSPQKI
jgi:hypothetical protein